MIQKIGIVLLIKRQKFWKEKYKNFENSFLKLINNFKHK